MKTDIDFICDQLRIRSDQRQLPRVAAGSGVGLRTLHRIMTTRTCTLATAALLQDYLSKTVRRKRLDNGHV